ncbi:YceH family protein [Acidimicrobiia bacterium EGI L10123]|uniref:YceH family protein n=1 Tax=Salinilacustrithrix flava TaxID=2957203 RepID=UPI003D7C1F9B|nr:YceH family protein [Acidimicrobiia bacterium EGI L10123]
MAEALEGPLTPIQQRVLGALAEKAATVPDTYPMTLRGLQTACNQKNNREPVTDHTEGEIQAALDELKARHLVRFVYASHGARSTKFRHVLDERLGLDAGELAVVTALLLRGPQTLNELRTRTERAHAFASNDEVATTLEGLAARTDPVVVHLPRQPGQKETRWAHLLGDGPDERLPAPTAVTPAPATRDAEGLLARVAELEDRVAALEALLTDPDHTTEEIPPT